PAAVSATLPPVADAAALAKAPLETGSSLAPGPGASVAVAAAPETSALAPEAVAAVPETPAPAPEVATPAPVPSDATPSDEQHLESAEPVPDEAIALATPDKSGERPVHPAPSPPPPPPQPASTVRAIDPSLPPLASAVRPIESWRPLARQRARGLRVGIAAVLVGAGFILGRLTAPTPSVTSPPVAAEPPMAAKASPVEAPLRGGNAAPPAPIETTATASTAGVAPPSAPHDPVETVGTAPASTREPRRRGRERATRPSPGSEDRHRAASGAIRGPARKIEGPPIAGVGSTNTTQPDPVHARAHVSGGVTNPSAACPVDTLDSAAASTSRRARSRGGWSGRSRRSGVQAAISSGRARPCRPAVGGKCCIRSPMTKA